MTKINVKGMITSNDDAEIYSWLGYDTVSPRDVESQLNEATDPVEVDIASNGGDVFAASEIYTMLKAYSQKVTVNIQGLAASAASVIAMAGDTVNMSPTSQMMIHKAAMFTEGNADDLSHDSKSLDVTDQSIVNAYEAKTGMNRDQILKMMSDETWMTAQDAVDKGFADAISVGQQQPQVVNSIASPILSHDAIGKIKNLLAKSRSDKPSEPAEKPVKNSATKEAPSLRDQKLQILFKEAK